jgi:diguanylate cyclase (GGDEF)-like protein
MDTLQDYSISDFDFLDTGSAGPDKASVRNRAYSVDSLIREIPRIKIIREKIIRHRGVELVEIKEEKLYSRDEELFNYIPEYRIIDKSKIKKEWGVNARELELIQQAGFLDSDNNTFYINKKFIICTMEDFHLGLPKDRERQIYKNLDRSLWLPVPEKLPDGKSHPLRESLFSRHEELEIFSHGPMDGFLFRFGNTVFEIDFHNEPSPELLELIRLKIALINQERLQNFFQIISMYSADVSLWLKKDKKEQFFETCGNLLNYSWRPFDMEKCIVSFSGTRGPYSFARGGLSYYFNWDGEPSWTWLETKDPVPNTDKNTDLEFMNKSIQVTLNKETIEPVTMDVYFKSRSFNNVDPLSNILLHGYIKFLTETIGKLIDLIIPIIQMERSEESLKWRTFFDRLRIRAMGFGENIDQILTDSSRIIKWFYNVHEVCIFIENPELLKMIRIYQAQNKTGIERPYIMIEKALPKEQILKGHYVPFYFNEEVGEQVVFYIKYKVSEPSGEYLNGTEFLNQILEEAEKINYSQISETVTQLFTTAMSYNPTISISNFLNSGNGKSKKIPQSLVSLSQRIFNNYAVFFDLLVSIHANLESGISRMRASRDRLTGLYNRQSFTNVLERYFNARNRSFGLMFIDMDSFKIYNDAISHHFGDKILIGLAELLLSGGNQILFPNISGRFGGDEFCFAVNNIGETEFELVAVKLFKLITQHEFDIFFNFDSREESSGFDINFIAFLYRMIRPDVGTRGDEVADFIDKSEDSPRGYILNILKHYSLVIEDPELNTGIEDLLFKNKTTENHLGRITDFLFRITSEKLLRNHILKEIDDDFETAIRIFIRFQLMNKSTDEIRDAMIKEFDCHQFKRKLSIRISAGLAHSKEYRLRSVSSLFKAADNRAYLSKHNGKNCLFGVDNQRLI